MGETTADLNIVKPLAVETLRRSATVALPNIDVAGRTIRLGMHTDSIGTLLKTLSGLPDLDALSIEGRVMTEEQQRELKAHPVYKFYMSGRTSRAWGNGKLEDVITFSPDINLKPADVTPLLQTPFTPAVLSDEIGYKTGYFAAKPLVSYWLATGQSNDFLAILGGTNEFQIGSNTLSDDRLSEIAVELSQAFRDQEASFNYPYYYPKKVIPPNFIKLTNHFSVNSLNLSQTPMLLDTQPAAILPGQVRDKSELKIGETYIEVHNGKKGRSVKILGAPYRNKRGDWWVKFEETYSDGTIHTDTMSLADRGIDAYSGGKKWNAVNCLVRETPGTKAAP